MAMHKLLLKGLTLAVASACASVGAQTSNGTDNPDWVEVATPQPPAFSTEHLIAIDMPLHVSVKVGVDPATIDVGADGVVRYVLVMTNTSGSVSAVYEGIRCVSDEVKTYARISVPGTWRTVAQPEWKGLGENAPSRHAWAFARQGGCQSKLATSPREIIAALKATQKLQPGIRAY